MAQQAPKPSGPPPHHAHHAPSFFKPACPRPTGPRPGEQQETPLATLRRWRARLAQDLWGSILPFWAAHSEDGEHGGFFNCLDSDGAVYDATKHVWLQGRQVYMYARLCSEYSEEEFAARVAAHPPARSHAPPSGGVATATPTPLTRAGLLAAAERGAAFLLAHAVAREAGTGEETVYFALARDGTPAAAQRKPFSAAFLALALGELATATGKAHYREEALRWLAAYLRWCAAPGGSGGALGKPGCAGAPALVPLNEPMITLNLISELARGLPEEGRAAFFAPQRDAAIAAVLAHASREHRAVFEGVAPATGLPDLSTPAGRLLNPGHAIEAGWFLLDAAKALGDAALRARALEIVGWAFEGGWDGPLGHAPSSALGAPAAEAAAAAAAAGGGAKPGMHLVGQGAGAGSGGMIYFRDALGYSPTQLEAHSKLWWPQAEAMIAFAKSYGATGEAAHLERFDVVASWTYQHLVTEQEWFGYADRTGAVTHRFKGGPYKGCFHVPRAVFLCEKELAEAITSLEAREAQEGGSSAP